MPARRTDTPGVPAEPVRARFQACRKAAAPHPASAAEALGVETPFVLPFARHGSSRALTFGTNHKSRITNHESRVWSLATRLSRAKPRGHSPLATVVLYSKMNMNRIPRSPLKTNDPCTLYSKTKRDLAGAFSGTDNRVCVPANSRARRRPARAEGSSSPSPCQSSHSPLTTGHCPFLLDTRARHASPYLQQNKRSVSPLLDTRFRRAAKRAASVPASPPPCFPVSRPVRYHEVRNIAIERRAQLSSAPAKRKPRRSEA